ncbi:hypothetical protein PVL29_016338 [Vitis rotundifolia]|uniref:Uncharacterized protein n=1 Tax=Vitis rotundifolia TaxID=103349 RepID=A0AA38Z7R8_VITRO|nr:hypothetical protein PVL29_016338 [Vitis rotundifolia]
MEMPSFSLRLQWWFFLVNLIICISSLRLESLSSTPTFGNETDKLASLTIKHYLVDFPNGVLSSWNDSLHFCQVTTLRLEDQSLGGSLPPIGNLTFLRELVLSNNHLHGTIPSDIGLLRQMQHLNLSTNSLQGEIPVELTNCTNLRTMDLTRNNLTGQIPFHFGHMSKLLILRLGGNSLTGVIPFTLGNLSSLQGGIPHDLSRLKCLKYLYLDVNNLSGMIPPSLYNWSSAIEFFLGVLKDLNWLSLEFNNLGRGMSGDLNFLCSLANGSSLRSINLQVNNFGCMLPNCIVNRSTQLQKLFIGGNKISGSIPKEIGNLISLIVFNAMQNNLTGVIPTSIGKLQNLGELDLGWNRLSGLPPSTLSNLSRLEHSYISQELPNMEILLLDHNKLCGSVPENVIGHFNQLRSLHLQQNTFTGSLPADVGQLKNLNLLLVSDNKLSGEIPRELGSCLVLEYLDMARNSFQGNIPLSFSSLRGIQFLDLSCNNLSGRIPNELEHLLGLLSLNLSYNYLEGEVPTQLQLPACSDVESAKHGKGKHLSTKIVIAISITGVSCLAFIVASVLLYRRKKAVMKSSSTFLRHGYLRVSYKELLKATSGFASPT